MNAGILRQTFNQESQTKDPEETRSVTLEQPPDTRMFDIPPSGKARESKPAAGASTPSVPSIVINMPDMSGSRSHRRSPMPSSDPIDPHEESWPSLIDFLQKCTDDDRHKRDFAAYQAKLEDEEFRGPDDIVNCKVEELSACGIPLGVGKYLIAQADKTRRSVKADARARKRQRID